MNEGDFKKVFTEKCRLFDEAFCDEYFSGKEGAERVNQFETLKNELLLWNKKINLTSVTDEEEITVKHFIDSISVIKRMRQTAGRMIDVGSGAGFPGIPIKILLKDLTVCLLDATAKKLKFSDFLINKLELENIFTHWGRAEDAGRAADFRETWDICAARALAPVNVLLEYCLPLLKVGGFLYVMKGPSDREPPFENALNRLGGKHIGTENFYLQGREFERNILVIEKVEKCDPKYPRKSGTPSKNPL